MPGHLLSTRKFVAAPTNFSESGCIMRPSTNLVVALQRLSVEFPGYLAMPLELMDMLLSATPLELMDMLNSKVN